MKGFKLETSKVMHQSVCKRHNCVTEIWSIWSWYLIQPPLKLLLASKIRYCSLDCFSLCFSLNLINVYQTPPNVLNKTPKKIKMVPLTPPKTKNPRTCSRHNRYTYQLSRSCVLNIWDYTHRFIRIMTWSMLTVLWGNKKNDSFWEKARWYRKTCWHRRRRTNRTNFTTKLVSTWIED